MNYQRSSFFVFYLALLFLIPSVVRSQYFISVYPTTYDKTARAVLQTADGGYIMAGMTNTTDITDCNSFVMKTDAAGGSVWQRVYGGSKIDYPYDMIETADGNYLIVGYSQSFGGGDHDIYMLKIDPSGGVIFEGKLDLGFGFDEAREIIKSADGNYVIVGTSSSGFSSEQIVLCKIDGNCGKIWTANYGGSANEEGMGVSLCPDGGYIISGVTMASGKGDMILIKTDALGVATGSVTYGGAQYDEGVAVVANTDGSYVVAIRDSSTTPDIDVRVMKFDAALTSTAVWNHVYGGAMKDTPKRIRPTLDGGFIVGTISRSFWGDDNVQMWWIKLDANGNVQWTQNYGWAEHEHCHDIKQLADCSYMAAGHSRSGPLPGQKIMLVRANCGGEVGLTEQLVENDFQLYPNPAKGLFYIGAGELPAGTFIQIKNTLGGLIYSATIPQAASTTIDLTGNAPGVYIASVFAPGNAKPVLTKKIIIQQ